MVPDPPLPCRQTPSASIPWWVHVQPEIAGTPFNLTLRFNPVYLQRLLFASPSLPVRSEAMALSPTTILLLSDIVPMNQQIVAVEVSAVCMPGKPDHLVLQAQLAASLSLPTNLKARLIWAGKTYQTVVDSEGRCVFGEVPLATLQADLEKGSELRIIFEDQDESCH